MPGVLRSRGGWVYKEPGQSIHNPLGRYSFAHEIRAWILRENPLTFAPDSKAASDSHWLGFLDTVINCQPPSKRCELVPDHLELAPIVGIAVATWFS